MSFLEIMLSSKRKLSYDEQRVMYNKVILKKSNFDALRQLCEKPEFDRRIDALLRESSDYRILKTWASLPYRTTDELVDLVSSDKRITVLKEIASVQGLTDEVYVTLSKSKSPAVAATLLLNTAIPFDAALNAFKTVFAHSSMFNYRVEVRGIKASMRYVTTDSVLTMWPDLIAPFIEGSSPSDFLMQVVRSGCRSSREVDIMRMGLAEDVFVESVLLPILSASAAPVELVGAVSEYLAAYGNYRYGNSMGRDPLATIAATCSAVVSNLGGSGSADVVSAVSELLERDDLWWFGGVVGYRELFSALEAYVSRGFVEPTAVKDRMDLISRIRDFSVSTSDLVAEILVSKDQELAKKLLRRADLSLFEVEKLMDADLLRGYSEFGAVPLVNHAKLALCSSRPGFMHPHYGLDFDDREAYAAVVDLAREHGRPIPRRGLDSAFFSPGLVGLFSSDLLVADDVPLVAREALAELVASRLPDPNDWVVLEDMASKASYMTVESLIDCVRDL